MLLWILKQCYSDIINITHICYFIYFLSIIYSNSAEETEIPNDVVDGEEFVKNLVDGEDQTGEPEHLLFTAPFKICKGGCNESNFDMSFPIYVGIKGAKHYIKTYPRDENLFKPDENYPFRKSTTRHPFTLCPAIKKNSQEQTVKPGCEDKVRIKKVLFKDSLEVKQHKEIALDPNPNGNHTTKPLQFKQVLKARNRVWRPLRSLWKLQ